VLKFRSSRKKIATTNFKIGLKQCHCTAVVPNNGHPFLKRGDPTASSIDAASILAAGIAFLTVRNAFACISAGCCAGLQAATINGESLFIGSQTTRRS
jgi:hypothetical protein